MGNGLDNLPLTPDGYLETIERVIEAENVLPFECDIQMSALLCRILSRTADMYITQDYGWYTSGGRDSNTIVCAPPEYYGSLDGFRVLIDMADWQGIWFRFVEK